MMSTDCTLYPGAWVSVFAHVNSFVNLTLCSLMVQLRLEGAELHSSRDKRNEVLSSWQCPAYPLQFKIQISNCLVPLPHFACSILSIF